MDFDKSWKLRAEFRDNHWTTEISELPVARM